jgi:hypothetical protein
MGTKKGAFGAFLKILIKLEAIPRMLTSPGDGYRLATYLDTV